MSIYASIDDIGMDDVEGTTGTVVKYPGSHLYPSPDDHAAVYLATIPSHCVPGHAEDEWGPVGPFLRVSIAPEGQMIAADVLLTEKGAAEMCDALQSWLKQPKSYPHDDGQARGSADT